MKWTSLTAVLAILAAPAAPAASAAYQTFYASEVIDYSPGNGTWIYDDPQWALGGPRGLGPTDGSYDVVTLGVQGSLTLGFEENLVLADGPGADLLVFENPIQFGSLVFGELVRVQVSSDGEHYVEFPTLCGIGGPVASFAAIDPALVSGFAGVTPVQANVDDPKRPGPFDGGAGGDAFDLADLADLPEVTGGLVRLDRIIHVRLIDVLGDGSETDSNGGAVFDPTGDFLQDLPVSADIDAIAVIHGTEEPGDDPVPGDTDGDGDVDHLDYLALKVNFGTVAGAGRAEGDFDGDHDVDYFDYAAARDHLVSAAPSGMQEAGAAMMPEPASMALLAVGVVPLLWRRRRGSRRRWQAVCVQRARVQRSCTPYNRERAFRSPCGALLPTPPCPWSAIQQSPAGAPEGRALTRWPRAGGFTLVELLVVVAILASLAGMLVPTLNSAMAIAESGVCQSNIRLLQLGNEVYQREHKGYFAPGAPHMYPVRGSRDFSKINTIRWFGVRESLNEPFSRTGGPLSPYLPTGSVAGCPSFDEFLTGFEAGCGGYGYNNSFVGQYTIRRDGQYVRANERWHLSGGHTTQFPHPSRTVAFTDTAFVDGGLIEYSFCEPPEWPLFGGRPRPSIHFRHLGKANVAWLDTHVTGEPMSFTDDVNSGNPYEGIPGEQHVGWFGPDDNTLFDCR